MTEKSKISRTIKFIDLFCGIGGFRIGLENANKYGLEKCNGNQIRGKRSTKKWKYEQGYVHTKGKQQAFCCVWSNEWDKYASSVYKKHYGECDTRDITTIPSSNIPDFDLLVAGFPCQAFSIAGKRKGFQDTRGTLFFDIARILADKRPRYFLLENVKGLLSHDQGKTFQTILGVLSDLGYEYQWQVLNSKNFGVPQNRERVFIVGHLRGKSRPKVFPIGENGQVSNQEQQQPIRREIQTSKQKDSSNRNKSVLEDGKDGQLHYIGGIEAERKKWLKDGKDNSRNFSQGQRVYGTGGISSTLAGNAGGLGGKTGLYAIRVQGDLDKRKTYLSNEIQTLSANPTSDNLPRVAIPMQWKRTEEGRKARQENQKKGKDYTPFGNRYRELVPNENKDVVGTITSQAIAKDSLLGEGTRIRRLTPVECARLQGFPDDWCEGLSNTQAYKCYGNAVTTNVVEEIGKRLAQVLI